MLADKGLFLFNRFLPENAIVSAISMGILNEGMFIWLVFSLVYLLVKVRTSEMDLEVDKVDSYKK